MSYRPLLLISMFALSASAIIADDPIDQNPGTSIKCTIKDFGNPPMTNFVDVTGTFSGYPFQSVANCKITLY